MQRVVKEFKGSDKVTSVILDNGEELEADLCIVGAGIIPATKFVKNDGYVKFERDGSIVVDQYLKAAQGLYVAGDLCRFPYFRTNEFIRVEHYGMAQYHGKVAAANMLKENSLKVQSIPFFWTVQFGKGIRYCGHAINYEEIIFNGNPEGLTKFLHYLVNTIIRL